MTLAWSVALVLKITLLLTLALILDALTRRRWVLLTASMWNAVLVAILALPIAALLVPSWSVPWPESATLFFPGENVGSALPADNETHNGVAEIAEPHAPIPADPGALNERIERENLPTVAMTSPIRLANISWPKVILVVYMFGASLALARLLANLRAVSRVRQRAVPVSNVDWLARWSHWQHAVRLPEGARRKVHLLASDEVDVPSTLGVFRRAILIPTKMAEDASRPTMDTVLVHELAHVARADYAWHLLECYQRACLWFHPLAWWSGWRMAFIRERACDEFAVHTLGDVDRYAATLLDLATHLNRRRWGLGLAVVRRAHLAERLSALAESAGKGECVLSRRSGALLAATVLLLTIGMASGSLGESPPQGTSKAETVAAEPSPAAPPQQQSLVQPPQQPLTLLDLARRNSENAQRIQSYDVCLDFEFTWPLKTVIVPVSDPNQPARRQALEWQALGPGEKPKVEKRRYRQVRSADKRRVERFQEQASLAVFDGTRRRVLNAEWQGSKPQGIIDKSPKVVDDNYDYEGFLSRVTLGVTLEQALMGRRQAHIANPNDDGLVLIEAPAGEGIHHLMFGWRFWLDPQHGYLPAKYEISRIQGERDAALWRRVEIEKFLAIEGGAWVPISLRTTNFNTQPGKFFGQAVNILHATVDVQRSRWNVELAQDQFVLPFPEGVSVSDMEGELLFIAGKGDTGRDNEQLVNLANHKVRVNRPQPIPRVDLVKLPEDERAAVTELRKWHLWLMQADNGSLKQLSLAWPSHDFERPGLSGVNLYDDAMPLVGKLRHLNWLDITGTEITDEGLAHLRGLAELDHLFLSNTKTTNKGVVHLAGLTKLKRLDLDNHTFDGNRQLIKRVQITDAGLVHLRGMVNLEMLDLRGNDITDAGLAHLQVLPRLRQIALTHTRVTAAGIKSLKDAAPNVKYVSFDPESTKN